MSLESLKKERKAFLGELNRMMSQVEAQIKKDVVDLIEAQTNFECLTGLYANVETLNQSIRSQLFESDAGDDEIAEEMKEESSQQIKYLNILNQLDFLIKKGANDREHGSEAGFSSVSTGGTRKKSVKLPKIELQKFNGDLKAWLGFWASFKKIHEDEGLDDADKFHYLLQSMEPDSKPYKIVTSYPPTAENYPKVVESLLDRFGNEDVQLQVYIRELLQLVIKNVTTKDSLPFETLYMELDAHLRALKSLHLENADPATWLFPLVESSLPDEILLSWQRSPLSEKDGSTENPPRTRLDILMDFMKNEVKIRERIELVKSGFHSEGGKKKKEKSNGTDKVPTLAGFHGGERQSPPCIFCDRKGHESKDCFKARKMPLEERKKKVTEKRACFRCLKVGHTSRKCRANVMCVMCNGKHEYLMCEPSRGNPHERQQHSQEPVSYSNEQKDISYVPGQQQSATVDASGQRGYQPSRNAENLSGLANFECSREVVLKTVMVNIVANGERHLARLFFDGGNQRSYILKERVRELRLNPHGSINVTHLLFKGKQTPVETHHKYYLLLERYGGGFKYNVEVRDTDVISANIPRVRKDPQLIEELKRHRIYYNDMGEESPTIDILIGADYEGSLLTGKIVHLQCGLTAQETKFGWILSGARKEIPRENLAGMMVMSMTAADAPIQQLWSLETLGIRDDTERKTALQLESEAKEKLFKTISRNEIGRYSVGLSFIGDHPALTSNRDVALKRLEKTTEKLVQQGKYEEYDKILKAWSEELGFTEEVLPDMLNNDAYYIPHRPVFKESLTTPVRPVFDCSCKVGKGNSLNDCLHKGTNYIQLIPELLLRFREKKIAVTADIRKAFQMIEVRPEDRKYLRFLWWENWQSNIIKEYQHTRVVFGATCSPFILGAVIEYHLNHVPPESKEVAKKLMSGFYVDNYIGSEDTIEQYFLFRDQATAIMADAQMELRMWMSNVDTLQDSETLTTSILGMQWNRVDDKLFVQVKHISTPDTVTKRVLLSTIQKIFDPLGFLSPALIPMKRLLQKSWINQMRWDEPLPNEEVETFRQWFAEIHYLQDIKIPRLSTTGEKNKEKWTLHTFTDASSYGYACSCFLRVESQDKVSVQMLMSKARVAPVKPITIPRLELMGCLLGARMATFVKKSLKADQIREHCWSDSTTAISWIKRGHNQEVFVRNRVKEIREKTKVEDWKHVPGEANPADLPSRGCTPKNLLASKWWEGPAWLKGSPDTWPSQLELVEVAEPMEEQVNSAMLLDEAKREYSYKSSVRILGWMLRFVHNCRKLKEERHRDGTLTEKELELAEMVYLKQVQEGLNVHEYKDLKPFIDQNGLVRIKTRLTFRDDLTDFKSPILLPRRHPVVYKLIREVHLKNQHAGTNFLMAHLRERFWIPQSRRTIKKVIYRCFRCRRYTVKPTIVEEAPLPVDRVKTAEPFEVTGIDLAGPLMLKNGKKAWIVIYTCAVYRAVFLDIVTSAGTRAFIKSMKRFIDIHGRPGIVYSDNGTNFVGASNLFKELDWKEVQATEDIKPIHWKFNPPSASWWGGFWERLIRIVKDMLRRTLGKAAVTFQELKAVLDKIADVMNGRPLTYVSEDPTDLSPLTPAMFLRTPAPKSFPESDMTESQALRIRFKHVQALKEELRRRFRQEYLGLLVAKPGKSTRPLQVGELVFVGSDLSKRMEWKLGRILEFFPGKDGISRVARVKVDVGELIRPVQRLYALEMDHNEVDVKRTRSGRQVKTPQRYGFTDE